MKAMGPCHRAHPKREVDTFLDENLDSGHIHPSKSPFTSPFFFVKKKDGML